MARGKNSGIAEKSGRPGRVANLIPFKPGQSGNPKGRPLGARDRRTVIWAALAKIAEKKQMTPEEVEEALQVAGIEKGLKGSFLHYAEISNGLYGKMTDKSEVEFKGKTLADLMIAAAKSPAASKNAKRSKPS